MYSKSLTPFYATTIKDVREDFPVVPNTSIVFHCLTMTIPDTTSDSTNALHLYLEVHGIQVPLQEFMWS